MKLVKVSALLFVLIVMVNANTLYAASENEINNIEIEFKDQILGTWDYDVTGVDPAYAKGVMHVVKQKGEYTVNIELPSGTITAKNVVVKGNEVTFALYVENILVSVNIVINGDVLTGSGNTNQGSFTMTGSRRK
ncbi:hypothetical protein GH721_16625 [Kriegella sp. EG-1]|nr:hypothetical protein [Flavobacteriaceae bacterium EG-1]